MIKEDWEVIKLDRANVDVVAGPDIKPGTERHRKGGLVGAVAVTVGVTDKVVVTKIRSLTSHAEQRMRVRN